jgi:hypothetical protein
VLAGAYPASLDDEDTVQLLTLLLELGVNTFVCLQAEVNIHIPEHSWRAGLGLRPYIRDAQRLLSKAQASGVYPLLAHPPQASRPEGPCWQAAAGGLVTLQPPP